MALGSQRAYARHRGITHRTVQKAIRDRRITAEPDGRIDFAKADAEWAANTDPAKPSNSVGGNPAGARHTAPRAGHTRGNGAAPASPLQGYAAARAVRESFEARIKEIEYKRLKGDLVDADEMRTAWFNTARRARNLLVAIPDRIVPVLAAAKSQEEMHRLLLAEINRACAEIAKEAKA